MYHQLLEVQGSVKHVSDTGSLGGFPPSYQQFASELGYGLLCGLFIIYVPFQPPHQDHPDAFHVANKRLRNTFYQYLDIDLEILKDENTRSVFERAVPFAISENGHFLFWDKQNPDANGEFPIYLADLPVSIKHVANDLPELISKLTDPDKVQSVMQFTRTPLPATFSPYAEIKYF
jgi:hypothetical protein